MSERLTEEGLEKMLERLSWADVPKLADEVKMLWEDLDKALERAEKAERRIELQLREDSRSTQTYANAVKRVSDARDHALKARDACHEVIGLAVSVLDSAKFTGTKKARKSWEVDKERVLKFWYSDVNGLDYPPKEES